MSIHCAAVWMRTMAGRWLSPLLVPLRRIGHHGGVSREDRNVAGRAEAEVDTGIVEV